MSGPGTSELMQPGRFAFERLQVTSRRRGKVTKLRGKIQLPELPLCHSLASPKSPDALSRVKLRGERTRQIDAKRGSWVYNADR
jgi:hypothetical protein